MNLHYLVTIEFKNTICVERKERNYKFVLGNLISVQIYEVEKNWYEFLIIFKLNNGLYVRADKYFLFLRYLPLKINEYLHRVHI